jgi:RNase adapter protein RapZ
VKDSFVVLTGLSGSGKSAAMRVFEDMGYYCVDNLPVALIPVFADLCARSGAEIQRVALGIDIREGSFLKDFPEVLGRLRHTREVMVLFLEAGDDVLARRFGETRRPHPMSATSEDLRESIRRERVAMLPIRTAADAIIDTSAFSVHDLKTYLFDNFREADRPSTLLVQIVSFGYKYGTPESLDLLFDVRFLSNPFFVEGLKGMTGRDTEVIRFLEARPEYTAFLDKTVDLLTFLLPLYVREGKSYLRIGVGCTGGKHRSVAVTERLLRALENSPARLRIQHRDIDRE